jgi:hypothetical protein
MRPCFHRFSVIALLFAAAVVLSAQTPSAILVGRVQDASGAVIGGASITLREVTTNEARTVSSSAIGEFTIPDLAPGKYLATVEKQGFRELVEREIVLEVSQTAHMDFTLQIGQVTERVEVTASVPLLNTENAVKGDVIESSEIDDLPLNGRDFTSLAYLVPGVTPKAEGGQGSNFTVNGTRAANTNFVVDGFNDVNTRLGNIQTQPDRKSVV